jgi:hypothetical protein
MGTDEIVPAMPVKPRRRRRRRQDLSRLQDLILLAELGAIGNTSARSPELRLMRAVLADAMRSVRKLAASTSQGASRSRLRRELEWFTSGDRAALFGFENICEALDIDAGELRRRLLASCSEPRTGARPGRPARSRSAASTAA